MMKEGLKPKTALEAVLVPMTTLCCRALT